MIGFETEEHVMGRSFWTRRVYVRSKLSGKTSYLDQELLDRTSALSQEVRRLRMTDDERTYCQFHILSALCGAATDASGVARWTFLQSPPERYVSLALAVFSAPEGATNDALRALQSMEPRNRS